LHALKLVLTAAALLALSGCQVMGYYAQAVSGQVEIWRETRPVEELLRDPAVDPDLQARLKRAVVIRDFASRELALPDNGSYRSYADLKRPFVVWNVIAAEEFSIRPKPWCFPVAGCVTYRGYFNEQKAQSFAKQLRAKGMDVFVAGVPAYSTIGWFDDPLLNTFVRFSQTEMARLIFHELAHQVLYVPGDTSFNESFASAVELEGIDRWLAAEGTASERKAFETMRIYRRGFIELLATYRGKLEALYLLTLSDDEKRKRKAETLANMKAAYLELKDSWGGFAGYDRFFAGELGNAQLASVSNYTEWLPAFRNLLARSDSLPQFYAAAGEISKLASDERKERLRALNSSAP
jgi:predicted aminopeptidase